jgi:hypothetical protein
MDNKNCSREIASGGHGAIRGRSDTSCHFIWDYRSIGSILPKVVKSIENKGGRDA